MFELKFAVVREDPQVEQAVVEHANARNILLVGSGGCSALHLKHVLPQLEVVAYDFNPKQLAHIEAKNQAVARGDASALNIEDASTAALNQCGAFEGLFRVLRLAFEEWIAPASAIASFFAEPDAATRATTAATWRKSRYWESIFASTFHGTLLNAMFGPAATQHAAPGSYPGYFQGVFEAGLAREDAATNPFLQHILLGYYKKEDAPTYTHARAHQALELREGSLLEMSDLARFDVVHLSNIFDWSDDAMVEAWAERLQVLSPGTKLITRQLNNERPLEMFLGAHFVQEEALGQSLQAADRSLFYNKIDVWERRA